ncbi:MAG TPA: hypothetical protein VEJ89_18200 [Myxococcaceae bacterium]|nr:hypothetical protein [Myxococcaceae bacterium]
MGGVLLLGAGCCTGCLEAPGVDGESAGGDPGRSSVWATAADAGVDVLTSGVMLPPPWRVEDSSWLLGPDGGLDHLDMRVELAVPTTAKTAPCPVPSGVYCDGFGAVDAAGRLVPVDTYAFLGNRPTCRTAWASGSELERISGVWQLFVPEAGPTFPVLAVVECAGVGKGASDAGTRAWEPTHDVADLIRTWRPGARASVRGVVVGAWHSSASSSYGFTLQDPDGAPRTGIRVVRPRVSSVPGPGPRLGDYVRVTGTASAPGSPRRELLL